MPKREMTIGVTVNLQNYESLRIEVEDHVESEEDVRSLIAFLDQTLALFGRGDPGTEKAVNHYRKRVLQGAAGGETGAPAGAPAASQARTAAPAPTAPTALEPVTPAEPAAVEQPEEAPAPKPAAKPAAKASAKTPAPSPTGAVCESCGAPVSAAEEKTSRLFVSKTLCKKCIQSL